MTKMVPCTYMVKTLKFFSGTKRPMTLEVDTQHWILKYYQVCSNDDPRMTLTYFTTRSTLVPYAFVLEKGKTTGFSKTIVVYDIKVGRCSQLNVYMNLEYQRSRSFVDLRPRSLRFNIFKLPFLRTLETPRPVEAKFYLEPSWDGGIKVSTNGLCHMTMSMIKNFTNLLFWNQNHWPLTKVTQIQHFQTSFLKKTQGRLKPNFIWSLSMGCWDENLFKCSRSHDQDSFQAHIW